MIELFLDSGAYSASTKGLEIDIYKYIDFIKKNKDQIYIYCNLDVIGNAEASWKNQEIMEAEGLSPLPVFHAGTDISYLERCLDNYHYFCLGAIAKMDTEARTTALDRYWKIICNNSTKAPCHKVHGFGLTSFDLMARYPWASVDSTSWIQYSAFGSILVPQFKNGDYDYSLPPWRVFVSVDSPYQKESGKHFSTFSEMEQEAIRHYVEKEKFGWGEHEVENARLVKLIKKGIANFYRQREKLNITYYQNLVKFWPKWPSKLNLQVYKKPGGFFSDPADHMIPPEWEVKPDKAKIYMVTSSSKLHIQTLKEMNQPQILTSYYYFTQTKEEKGLYDVFGENTIFAGPETPPAGAGIPRDRRG
jgi:hypothetical protein